MHEEDRGLMPMSFADLDADLEATATTRLDDFVDLLRIPSISALSEHAGDCQRAAEWIVGRLQAAGMEHAEAADTGGRPVVVADWLHAEGAPTVIVYAHYDVQPVDPLELWLRPPFEPTIENGRLFARGAADDKSHVALLTNVLGTWLRVRGGLPINVKVVFEGEEESGSENLDAWLAANTDRLAADLVVISDNGFFDGNLPAITTGLRGMMYAQVDVVGPDQDLHSGGYGGTLRNPATVLAGILAGLHDDSGRVTLPGFYDAVVPLDERERAEFARLPFDEAAYMAEMGVTGLFGEDGYSTLERRGGRPTLDVNGLWGGFQGEGAKTIIPAHAHAKVSCRLVPDQDPAAVFAALQARVAQLAPADVDVTVKLINWGRPSRTPPDHPATIAAAASLEEVFGKAPLYVREGGSIPVAASFATTLDVPVTLLGFMNADCRAHSPNEFVRLDNWEQGHRAMIRFWSRLADAGI
jgi:acetylornithine deacetylase/succinyl-diaminopimelate desuccinylase-like protein